MLSGIKKANARAVKTWKSLEYNEGLPSTHNGLKLQFIRRARRKLVAEFKSDFYQRRGEVLALQRRVDALEFERSFATEYILSREKTRCLGKVFVTFPRLKCLVDKEIKEAMHECQVFLDYANMIGVSGTNATASTIEEVLQLAAMQQLKEGTINKPKRHKLKRTKTNRSQPGKG